MQLKRIAYCTRHIEMNKKQVKKKIRSETDIATCNTDLNNNCNRIQHRIQFAFRQERAQCTCTLIFIFLSTFFFFFFYFFRLTICQYQNGTTSLFVRLNANVSWPERKEKLIEQIDEVHSRYDNCSLHFPQ